MDYELSHDCSSFVGVSTVPKKQINEMLELHNREIRAESRLLTFFADYTDTDVCREDHAHVITAVTDAEGFLVGVVLDTVCDVGLLSGRAPATDDRSHTAGI